MINSRTSRRFASWQLTHPSKDTHCWPGYCKVIMKSKMEIPKIVNGAMPYNMEGGQPENTSSRIGMLYLPLPGWMNAVGFKLVYVCARPLWRAGSCGCAAQRCYSFLNCPHFHCKKKKLDSLPTIRHPFGRLINPQLHTQTNLQDF